MDEVSGFSWGGWAGSQWCCNRCSGVERGTSTALLAQALSFVSLVAGSELGDLAQSLLGLRFSGGSTKRKSRSGGVVGLS